MPQVGPTQVQPQAFPLLLIAPVHRPASTLVRRQQPLDISASQPEILEGVDTLPDVGLCCEALGKIELAVSVDFWLGAPGSVSARSGGLWWEEWIVGLGAHGALSLSGERMILAWSLAGASPATTLAVPKACLESA